MQYFENIIIGAGPTGMGAALRFQETDSNWLLLEAEDRFGGLAASFIDQKGFTWDLGGHVLFSHYDLFDRYMDKALGKNEWIEHQRESWIWMRNRFIPYPFQNNLHRLDPDDRWTCVSGLLDASSKRLSAAPPLNFEEWMLASMGSGITDIFLRPYNLKVWAYPLSLLAYGWIGERVAQPDLRTVLRSICYGEDNIAWGPNQVFRFPRRGGTGAIWQSLGGMLDHRRVRLKTRVTGVATKDRLVRTEDGQVFRYGNLISTIPLNHLIRITGDVVDVTEADKLLYSSTHVIGFGMQGTLPEPLKNKCWMYFPEANSPYYRVTVFSNYSPYNLQCPGKQWSLMAEVAESNVKKVNYSTVVRETQSALAEDGLLPSSSTLLSSVHVRLPHGYPTPFLGRDDVVDPILRTFESNRIYSRGRFGAWKYEVSNQDHSFSQGYECATRLVTHGNEACEVTLFAPESVNRRCINKT